MKLFSFESLENDIISFREIERKRNLRQYQLIFLIGATFIAAFTFVNFLEGRNSIGLFLLGCLITVSIINLYALKSDNFIIAGWLYSSVLFSLVVYLVLTGGVLQTGPLWTYPIVVIIVSLLGPVTGFFLSALLIGLLILIFLFAADFTQLPRYATTFQVRYIATLIALTGLVWSIEYARSRAFDLLNKLYEDMLKVSRTDQLTGLLNRRGFEERFAAEVNLFQRQGKPFSLLLIDVDNFKMINDRHGHLVGDAYLKKIATILRSEVRSMDAIGRWGGEEFIILLTSSTQEQAVGVANKIRNTIENLHQVIVDAPEKLTISIGVAQYREGESLTELTDAADRALYEAKKSGKNRVSVSKLDN